MSTYGDLCSAVIDQLANTPELADLFDSMHWDIDCDLPCFTLGTLSVMDLARFITAVAGRMGWDVHKRDPELVAAMYAQHPVRRS